MAVEFSDFYRTEYPRLAGSLSLASNDELLAEELAQETFTRALHHWERVRVLDRPSGWLYTTGFNLLRKQWKRSQIRDAVRSPSTTGPNETELSARMDLANALALLPATQRTAVVLRHILDYSTDEVSAMLELNPDAVRSLLHRGIKTLRTTTGLSLADEPGKEAHL